MVPALQACGEFNPSLTWAFARLTRFSPGYHMSGLQPEGVVVSFPFSFYEDVALPVWR